jgi:hypothetical protein
VEEVVPDLCAQLGVLVALVGPDDVLGGEFLAVVERDAFVELELVLHTEGSVRHRAARLVHREDVPLV